LDLRHEVPSRHPVYLWVADVCHWGGRRPQDATPGASTRASYSCSLIYIRQYLLRFRSICKLIRGILIMMSTLWTFTRAPSSSSSASSPSRDSSDEYLEIRPMLVGNPQRTTISSLWWPQTGIGPTIAPVGIPLLEDQRHPMPKPLARGWFKI
jgi:hypothetical protein